MNSNKFRKAQGMVEYVMNYGWVVIIIMIVGVTMWYLGIFNTEQYATTSTGLPVIKPVLNSILLRGDCNFSGVFINAAGNFINITNISIVNSYENPPKGCISTGGTGIIEPSQAFLISASTCCLTPHEPGDLYKLEIDITYTLDIGGTMVEHTDSGTIYGVYGVGGTGAFVNCSDQGGECCTDSGKMCPEPLRMPSADCAQCCPAGSCVTTTTTTSTTTTSTTSPTSTTTTTTSTTTTTTPGTISSVVICGVVYPCGANDGICPTDFASGTCSDPDC